MERFSEFRIPFLTILFFFGALFLYTQLFGPVTIKINSQPNLFYVDGTAEQTGVPTTAVVMLGVTETGQSADTIKENLNTKSNRIVTELKKLGIEDKDIKTTNYSLNPNYDLAPRPLLNPAQEPAAIPSTEQISGYTASQYIEVKTENVELANRAIDVATRNGANVISGVSFSLSDAEREELEQEAREKAIANAKNKAKTISRSAGLRLGKLVNVSESTGPYPFGVDQAIRKETPNTSSTELNPGETTVEITVTLTYETL